MLKSELAHIFGQVPKVLAVQQVSGEPFRGGAKQGEAGEPEEPEQSLQPEVPQLHQRECSQQVINFLIHCLTNMGGDHIDLSH